MKHVRLVALFSLCSTLVAMGGASMAGETPSPAGAKVYFVNLKDGATVSSPVKIIFGLSGMGIAPAGTEKKHTGHHHLLIDRAALGKGPDGKEELDANIPADENHKHFGKGQTEVLLKLSPGKHTLQLVLGDQNHIPHTPAVVSSVITVTVK
jgi:Domain of unknown function (DUF4399)